MKKKLIIIFSIIIGLVVIGFGGFYVYKHYIYDYESEVIELVDDFLEDGEYEDIKELKSILRSYAKTNKLDSIRLVAIERIESNIDSFYRENYRSGNELNDEYNELREYIDELYEECVVNVDGSVYLIKESKYEEIMEDLERVLEDKKEDLNTSDNYANSSSGSNNDGSSSKENQEHIEEDVNTKEFTNLVTISYDELKSMLEMDTKILVVISRTGCSWCTKFEPVLNRTLKELNMVGYRLDLATLDNEELQEFNARFVVDGTPTTFIIESGQIVDKSVGYMEEETLTTWINSHREQKDFSYLD